MLHTKTFQVCKTMTLTILITSKQRKQIDFIHKSNTGKPCKCTRLTNGSTHTKQHSLRTEMYHNDKLCDISSVAKYLQQLTILPCHKSTAMTYFCCFNGISGHYHRHWRRGEGANRAVAPNNQILAMPIPPVQCC